MLIGGVFIERKRAYAIFARGLIGGGWAALYFTTYAMHALPAAKVIDNPYLATALLLAVACGMILHSLRYKSQTVSGLAYFIAFATLALSESTPFSVLALLPLAASLLYLAHRFDWHQMAVFGLFATYATCASRPDVGAPLASTQALFAMYWLLFETFDLFRLRRSTASWTIESFILPDQRARFSWPVLREVAALGSRASLCIPGRRRRCLPGKRAAARTSASAIQLRPGLRHARSNRGRKLRRADHALGGAGRGAPSCSAPLANGSTSACSSKARFCFSRDFVSDRSYLRQLAGAAFAGSVIKTVLVDASEAGSIVFAGRTWASWSPIAALSAAVFYINRMLRVTEGALYSSTAAGLIAMVLGYETPQQYLSVAWLVFAAASVRSRASAGGKRSSDTSRISLARSAPARALIREFASAP